MKIFITVISLFLMTVTAHSHRGGLKKRGPFKGCHNDRKNGGFHCHSGPHRSKTWRSEQEALASVSDGHGSMTISTAPLKIRESDVYVRAHWGYGIDGDSDCQNTRAEVLIRRSKKPVVFKNSKKCIVLNGEWDDFYFPEQFTEASKLQIDHVVPLKNAHVNGGSTWSPTKKREFANDPDNLVITSVKTNATKSDQGIDTWNPIFKEYACKYHQRWISIKTKYGLIIPENEMKAVDPVACAKFNKPEIVKSK